MVILVVVRISIALHFDSRKANSHTRKVAKGKQCILATTMQISDKYNKCAIKTISFNSDILGTQRNTQ